MRQLLKMNSDTICEEGTVAYRFFDSPHISDVKMPRLVNYKIVKRTTKGFKIDDYINGVIRQVFVNSCTQYAHENKRAALDAYRGRKIKQRIILSKQLEINMAHFDNIGTIARRL